jgi:hypothetical protein
VSVAADGCGNYSGQDMTDVSFEAGRRSCREPRMVALGKYSWLLDETAYFTDVLI